MKSYTKQPQPTSRVIESNPRATRQAPLMEILQMYRKTTMPVQRSPEKVNKEKADPFYFESEHVEIKLIKTGTENVNIEIFRLVGTEQTIYWFNDAKNYQIKLSDGSFTNFDMKAYAEDPQFLDFLTSFKEVSKATTTEDPQYADTKRALQMHVLQKFLSNALYSADEMEKMHYQASPLNFQEGGSYIRSEATAFVDALKEFLQTGVKAEYLHLVQQLDFNEIMGQFTYRFASGTLPETKKIDEIAQFLIDKKSLKNYSDAYGVLFADATQELTKPVQKDSDLLKQTEEDLTTIANTLKQQVLDQVKASLVSLYVESKCKDELDKKDITTELVAYFSPTQETELTKFLAYINNKKKAEHKERINNILNEKNAFNEDTDQDTKDEFYKNHKLGTEITGYKEWLEKNKVDKSIALNDQEQAFLSAKQGGIPKALKDLIGEQSFTDYLNYKKENYISLTKDEVAPLDIIKDLTVLNKDLVKNLSEILLVGGSIAIPGTGGIEQPGFLLSQTTSKSLIESVKHALNKTGYVPSPTTASKKMLAMGKPLAEIVAKVAEMQKSRTNPANKTLIAKMDKAIQIVRDFKPEEYTPITSTSTADLLQRTAASFEEFKKLKDESKEYIKLQASAVIRLINELKLLDEGNTTPGIALAELQVNLQDATTNKDDIAAYIRNIQNIHELIIMELERKPATVATPSPQVASQLPPETMQPHYTDYGLKAFTQAFNAALAQHTGHTPFVVDSYSNIYFELLQKLHDTQLASGGKTTVRNSQSFSPEYQKGTDESASEPDLIMIDIHPNDASKQKMQQNDIVQIIEARLKGKPIHPKLTVIVDITLNHAADDEIKDITEKVKPYIDTHQLNLVFIQSLTKFAQLGMDKHSGGLMFHYNSGDAQWKVFNDSIRKSTQNAIPDTIQNYFDLLFGAASNEQKAYILLVRQNTKYVYDRLNEEFGKQKIATGKTFDLSLNQDEGTCYVAFNYEELSGRLFAGSKDRDSETEMLGKRILNEGIYNVINKLKLPLSMRQSFGFPISNLGEAWVGSRFTIGTEEKGLLDQYINVVAYVRQQISMLPDDVLANDKQRIAEFKKFADNIDTIEQLRAKLPPAVKMEDSVMPSVGGLKEEPKDTLQAGLANEEPTEKKQVATNEQ